MSGEGEGCLTEMLRTLKLTNETADHTSLELFQQHFWHFPCLKSRSKLIEKTSKKKKLLMRNQASALSNENWLLRKFSSCEQIFTEDVPWDGRWQLKKKTTTKPIKIVIFDAMKKKQKSKKLLQNWMKSQEGSTRVLFKWFFGYNGAHLGGPCPPKENHYDSC